MSNTLKPIVDLTESDLISLLTAAAEREPKQPYTPYDPSKGQFGEIAPATEKQIKLIAKLAVQKDSRGFAVGECEPFGFGALSMRSASGLISNLLGASGVEKDASDVDLIQASRRIWSGK